MIASDANNPEFTGAYNPDSRLSKQFYKRAVFNEFQTKLLGKDVFDDVVYVKIFIPGDDKTVIDTPANADHKKRFPLEWAHYLNTSGSLGEIGTPISEWGDLTPAQVEELRYRKFFTVEHIANAGDAHIQSIGMLAGMAAHKFRDKARAFLKKPEVSNEAVEELKKETQEQKEQIAQLLAAVNSLTEKLSTQDKQKEPAKRGRAAAENPVAVTEPQVG